MTLRVRTSRPWLAQSRKRWTDLDLPQAAEHIGRFGLLRASILALVVVAGCGETAPSTTVDREPIQAAVASQSKLYTETDTRSTLIAELAIGDRVGILRDAGVSDGMRWFRVEASNGEGDLIFGWLAVDAKGPMPEAVTPIQCRDPDRLSVGYLWSLDPFEPYFCYRDRDLVLEPVRLSERPRLDDQGYTGDPGWLAERSTVSASGGVGSGDAGRFPVHIDPELGQPPLAEWLRIRGHFADLRAVECVRKPSSKASSAETPEEQVLWCRQQFVVSGFERVPTPTSPPGD